MSWLHHCHVINRKATDHTELMGPCLKRELCHFTFTKQGKMQICCFFLEWIKKMLYVFFSISLFNMLSLVTLYYTATYREFGIGTAEFEKHNHFQYSHWLSKLISAYQTVLLVPGVRWRGQSKWEWWGRWPVAQYWSLDRSLVLFCFSMLCSNHLNMVGMNKYVTL